MACPLCARERLTPWLYEDSTVWVAKCKAHPDKWMIVLKRHAESPTPKELAHMKTIAKTKLQGKEFRHPKSILDHFHLHQV